MNTNDKPAPIVSARIDVGSPQLSTKLARATRDGLVDCDGRQIEGRVVGEPRPATLDEAWLFLRCECESVTLLGRADTVPSPALVSVRTGARVVVRGGEGRRIRQTLTGVAPMAMGAAPAPGSTPPLSETRYRVTDLEPELAGERENVYRLVRRRASR